MAWASPILPVLISDKSPLPFGSITVDDAGNAGALFCAGGSFGTLIFGLIADKFGRKRSVYFCAMPLILSWLLKILASSVWHVLLARLLAGFAGAGVFLVIPIFVTEISDDKIRGALGSYLTLLCSIGIGIGYAVGGYLDYYTFSYLALIVPGLFLILFFRAPETPLYLLSNSKFEDAKKSISFYRGEMLNEKISVTDFLKPTDDTGESDTKENSKTKLSDFTTPASKKAIIIFLVILFMTQLSGIFLINNYMATIFKEAGTALDPNLSSIICTILQTVAIFMASILVDRAGRKILLSLSAFLTAICHTTLAGYLYMKELEYDVSSFNWLPILAVAGIMFNSAWGILTIPYCMGGEILSQKIRGIVFTFGMAVCWLIGLVLLKYFHLMMEVIGLHGSMFLFAVFCYALALFVLIYVPETKGKSIDEIIKLLGSKNK